MNNHINTFFTLRLNIRSIFSKLIMPTFCLGVILFDIGISVAAVQANCVKERMAITQAFSASLPANPSIVNNAIILRQEGEVLCKQGEVDSGRAKLKKAFVLLKPDTVADDLAYPKGESHE